LKSDEFDTPLFCDMYDDYDWQITQKQVKSPYKMMKSVVYDNVGTVLLQPYHTEVRKCVNNQFYYLLRASMCNFIEFDHCADCLKWVALALEFNIPLALLASRLRCLGVMSCTAYAGAGVSQKFSQHNQKLTNLGEHLGIVPKSRRIMSVGVDIGVSKWDTFVIDFLKKREIIIHEVCEPGVPPLYRITPSIVSGDGVLFYRNYTRLNNYCSEAIMDIACVDYDACDAFVKEKNFTIVDKVEQDERMLLHCAANGVSDNDLPECLPVVFGWRLPGKTFFLPCLQHNVNSQCSGLWCDASVAYGLWYYNGKNVVVKAALSSNYTVDTCVQAYRNYAFNTIDGVDDFLLKFYSRDLMAQVKFKFPDLEISDSMRQVINLMLKFGGQLGASNELTMRISGLNVTILHDRVWINSHSNVSQVQLDYTFDIVAKCTAVIHAQYQTDSPVVKRITHGRGKRLGKLPGHISQKYALEWDFDNDGYYKESKSSVVLEVDKFKRIKERRFK